MSGARRISALAVVLLAAGVATACSSSGNSSGTSSPSATPAAATSAATGSTATGSAITLMVLDTENGPEANSPEDVAGAQAAAIAINASGGINGHEVKIISCNDQFNPNVAAQCGRTAAADHVVATIGSQSTEGASVDPVLQSENIPQVGNLPISPIDNTNSMSFPLVSGAFFNYPGQAIEMIKYLHLKRIVIAEYNLAPVEAIGTVVKQAITAAGGVDAGTVLMPTAATDMTSFAAQIVDDHAQGVDVISSPQACLALLKAARQLGSQATFSNIDGVVSHQELESAGSLADGMAIVGYLPPVSASNLIPGVANYVKQMAAASAAGVPNASGLNLDPVSEQGWLSVYAVQAVAKSITGPITNLTLLSALRQAKGLNIAGIVTNWSPSIPGPTGFSRIFNTSVWMTTVKNSTPVLLQNAPINVASIIGLK
jgi:ABC-type branched-subunit amino acid transport system substrate-binding protein